jgi:hypothetical protein
MGKSVVIIGAPRPRLDSAAMKSGHCPVARSVGYGMSGAVRAETNHG